MICMVVNFMVGDEYTTYYLKNGATDFKAG